MDYETIEKRLTGRAPLTRKAETTEWDDILVKHGIKEAAQTDEETMNIIENAVNQVIGEEDAKTTKLENASLEDLEEMEDDEDERVLLEYKKKRLAEMKALASRNIFGSVVTISETEYSAEVTEGSKTSDVVVHMYNDSLPHCQLLDQHLGKISLKFGNVKFVRIKADRAVKNYPDSSLPTLLIYRNTNVLGQIVGLAQLGGDTATVEDVEWCLASYDVIKTKMTENPRRKKQYNIFGFGGNKSIKNNNYDDDSDSDSDY